MAKKIILFLSEFRQDAREKEYACPGDLWVTGRQTNEAPVNYLLQVYPDISEILCIVTPKAISTAWEQFSIEIQAVAPQVKLEQIPFVDGADFTAGPLADIMQRVQQGDEIYLETTGGFRNAVMHLLLLSRILSYKGIKTTGAVYSNFTEGEIQDVSHLISLFDFVGGMQELTSFGNTRTLRTYFGSPASDPYVENLLKAMEDLTEAITLCRTKEIDGSMQAFDDALTAAENCSDPLMRQLLSVFQQKFGKKGKKLTTPGLIKWCLQSDMLQQALTVYTERIPAYIIRSGHHLLVSNEARRPPVHSYEDPDAAQFNKDFLTLSKRAHIVDVYDNSVHSFVETLKNLDYVVRNSGYRVLCSLDQMHTICMDYLYIKMLRNMTNHANSEGTEDQEELLDYLESFGYAPIDRISSEAMRQAILDGLDHLRTFTPKGGNST